MIFCCIGGRFRTMIARPGSLQELSARALCLVNQPRDFRIVELEDIAQQNRRRLGEAGMAQEMTQGGFAVSTEF